MNKIIIEMINFLQLTVITKPQEKSTLMLGNICVSISRSSLIQPVNSLNKVLTG